MFCRLLFYLLALMFLTATVQAEQTARKTLRWMGHWQHRGLREQLVLEVRDEFQFLHQDVDIECAFLQRSWELGEKLSRENISQR